MDAAPNSTSQELLQWIEAGNWLEMRAAAAALAEPNWLALPARIEWALGLHQKIIRAIAEAKDRKAEEFLILRQALGYSLSVVVSGAPVMGFAYLRSLVDTNDSDILWILKSNLKKKRLVKNFPEEVKDVVLSLR
jgi:hypothetical protein